MNRQFQLALTLIIFGILILALFPPWGVKWKVGVGDWYGPDYDGHAPFWRDKRSRSYDSTATELSSRYRFYQYIIDWERAGLELVVFLSATILLSWRGRTAFDYLKKLASKGGR